MIKYMRYKKPNLKYNSIQNIKEGIGYRIFKTKTGNIHAYTST